MILPSNGYIPTGQFKSFAPYISIASIYHRPTHFYFCIDIAAGLFNYTASPDKRVRTSVELDILGGA